MRIKYFNVFEKLQKQRFFPKKPPKRFKKKKITKSFWWFFWKKSLFLQDLFIIFGDTCPDGLKTACNCQGIAVESPDSTILLAFYWTNN